MGPAAGERWRNRRTGAICAVLETEQHRYAWVTCRFGDSVQVLRGDSFLARFERV